MAEHASWEFEEGEALHPGRVVLKAIGGGSRYEVFLVWDESLYPLGVAKSGNSGPGSGDDDDDRSGPGDGDDGERTFLKTDDTSRPGHSTRGTTRDNDTRTDSRTHTRTRDQTHTRTRTRTGR